MARDTGNHFGKDQIKSKNKFIIEEFCEKQIKDADIIEINKQKIKEAFTNKLIKPNKTYYLAYNYKEFEIYTLEGLKWDRKDLIEAELKINNSTIRFINFYQDKCNILFESGAIILEQYEKGFKDNKEQLFANIETEFTKSEIKKIKDSPLKTKKDVKEMLKIRVAEKFNIKRDNSKHVTLIKFK